jgi:superoxide dismutase, Cu-Zn family
VSRIRKLLLITSGSVLALSACGNGGQNTAAHDADAALLDELAPASWADAAGQFIGVDGAPIGHIVLTNTPRAGVLMRVDLAGVSEGWHAIHLHKVGDCSDFADGFKASGSHVDPDDQPHGLLNIYGPERADMPNIYAGADGHATAELFNGTVALFASEASAAQAGPFPLFDDDGFAVIVHESADDHTTQPIGGAGKRIACAAIRGAG